MLKAWLLLPPVITGAVAFLAFALEQDRAAGQAALGVLKSLVTSEHLPSQQKSSVLKLLVRANGLRRCSTLLCPRFTKQQSLGIEGTLAYTLT